MMSLGGKESRMILLRSKKDLSLRLNSTQDLLSISLNGMVDISPINFKEENSLRVDKKRLLLLMIAL